MLPIYRDKGYTGVTRSVSLATRGVTRKVLMTAVAVTLTIVLTVLGHPVIAVLVAFLALGPGSLYAVRAVRRKSRVKRLANIGWSGIEGLPPARQTLLELGIAEATVDRVALASQAAAVRIATFDQDNRVLSDIGPIPFFADVLTTPQEFRKRARNVLELVTYKDVVCIRKTYGNRSNFEQEVLALHALTGVPGVPRLLAVQHTPPAIYESFVMGRSIGSLMTSRGASVSVQYRVSTSFDAPDRWNPGTMAQARDVAVQALRASAERDVIAKAADLIDRIHLHGVTIGDVKYGNVLVVDGLPYICDFEGAEVHSRNDWRFVNDRATDREKFNYFFDGDVLSERAFRGTVALLAREKPDLFYAPIYYGHGYESRAPGSIELGSGKWHFIRPYLPDLVGKSIVDLGCNNALLPLEMLRAGARRVTGYELNPTVARYARLNHHWFEFVDNKRYLGFQLIEGHMHEACDRDWSGYDVATAFCSLYYEEPEEIARIVRTFSKAIDCFVVQANENRDEHAGVLLERSSLRFLRDVLGANGYPDQTVIEFPYYDRPLVIGRRSKR